MVRAKRRDRETGLAVSFVARPCHARGLPDRKYRPAAIGGGRATNFRPASSHGVPSSLGIEPTLRLGAASSATTAAPRRERPLLFGRVRYWCPTSALPITERY